MSRDSKPGSNWSAAPLVEPSVEPFVEPAFEAAFEANFSRERRALCRAAGILASTPLSLGSLLLMGPTGSALAAAVLGVRVWPAAEYTRITIESDTPLVARHQRAENPERLVIDIDGLELSSQLRDIVSKVKADDPYIAGVRVGQYQPRVVRLVVDLRQAIAPQVFTLEPVAAYRHRLVFDLFPLVPVDPLLALIRDKLRAEGQAAQSLNDALGDFIGQLQSPAAVQSARTAQSPSASSMSSTSSASTAPSTSPAPSIPNTTAAAATSAAAAPPGNPRLEPGDKLDRLVIVALDPGHGGEDPGAVGPSGLKEKDVVLSVALQLRDHLNALPGMRAFLTRDGDYFVPLHERVRKARRVQADLFVSIHADAYFTPAARGASVYVLSDGAASSSAARWMAERENAADGVGGMNVASQDAQVMRTLLDMSTAAQIRDSLQLGGVMLGQLDRVGRLHKRRVEQAGFAVLKAPDIPSVLVETAFISNPEEEARLADDAYRAELARALMTGIRQYFARNPPLARQRTV